MILRHLGDLGESFSVGLQQSPYRLFAGSVMVATRLGQGQDEEEPQE